MSKFDGTTYNPAHDASRLSNQLGRVYNLMSDAEWRDLEEIKEHCGGTVASVSARLRDFRKAKFGGHVVNRVRVGSEKRGYYKYQLVIKD